MLRQSIFSMVKQNVAHRRMAGKLVLGSTLIWGLHGYLTNTGLEEAEMCGIVGYLGERKRAFEVISNGIKILENRGYDSCGNSYSSRRLYNKRGSAISHQIRYNYTGRRLHRKTIGQ